MKIRNMIGNSSKMLVHVLCLFVILGSVTMYPAKVKLDSENMELTEIKNPVQGISHHGRLAVKPDLLLRFSDILKSYEEAFNRNSRLRKRSTTSSKVSSRGLHVRVNSRIYPSTFDQGIETAKGQSGTAVDSGQKNTQPSPLHQKGADFLKSLSYPAVNHRELPQSKEKSLIQAELRLRPEKSRSQKLTYVYETDAGENTNGVQKAAKASLYQAEPRPYGMILIISSTVVVLLVTGVTISVFHCCCRKKQNVEELRDQDETKSETDNTAQLLSRNSVHDTPTYRPLSISDGDGLEEKPQLSVRDKIKAFEGQSKPETSNKTSTPDQGKPVRKRPKSKAFEEFENQGIIIGMGMVKPSRPKSTVEIEPDTTNEPGLLNEIMASMSSDYNNITMMSDTSDKIVQNGCHVTPDTEKSVTGQDDDLDDFSGIERNTHILRSFKRAPPPKNRSRSKRASRRRLPLQDTTNISENSAEGQNDASVSDTTDLQNGEEQNPTDTSVQRVWSEFGSPSIHSSDSRTDIDKFSDMPTNGNRQVIVNGHTSAPVSRGEESRMVTDREATPPDKSSTNEATSQPPPGMKMYDNPCYESLDVVQASINRASKRDHVVNGTHQSSDKRETSQSPPRKTTRSTTPSRESRTSPGRSDYKASQSKSRKRDSPESHISPERGQPRTSPPKQESCISPGHSEKTQSWKEDPTSDNEPPKTLKQTHL